MQEKESKNDGWPHFLKMEELSLSTESKNRMLYIANIPLKNKSKLDISNKQSQGNSSQQIRF